jgi:hypothetical protein
MKATSKAQRRAQKKQKQRQQQPQVDPPLLEEKLSNCNFACAAEIRAIYREHIAIDSTTLLRMWHQGKRVQNLKDCKAYREPLRGDIPVNAVQITADLLNVSPSWLLKTAQFYKAYEDPENRDDIVSKRMARSGRPLNWNHMEQLLKLLGHPGRFHLVLKATLENDWSPEEVEKAVRRQNQATGRKDHVGGRPLAIPTTFLGKVARFLEQLKIFVRHSEEIYGNAKEGFVSSLKNMSQEEVANSAEELQVCLADMKDIRERVLKALHPLADEFTEAGEYIEVCARQQAEQAGHEEAAAIDAKDAEQ